MKSGPIVLLGLLAMSYNTSVLAQDLNFDAPAVEEKSDARISSQIGPISNLTLGGAIDWRVMYVNGSQRPAAFIHVNEFVVSANVGKYIAVSAEQLLLTSEVASVVGQDHGFATISLVQLPFLPDGMSLKIGRFRGKFGLDAQIDSPANIFPSQALRSNGFATDIGLNVDYALGDFEWIIEVFNGPDYKNMNGQKQPELVSKPPVQSRFVYQPDSSTKVGLSGFYGETFDNQVDPTSLGMSSLGSNMITNRSILRKRLAIDVSAKTPWAELYAEGIYGRDVGRISQPVEKSDTEAKGFLGRVDVPLFRINDDTRTKLAFQYDTWQDGSFNGRVAFFSTAFSILNDEGWTYRIGGTANDLAFKSSRPEYVHDSPWSMTTQLLVSF